MAGKAIAGEIFTAYALGGLASSIYIYVIGPTIISKNKNKSEKIVLRSSVALIAAGLALALVSRFVEQNLFSSLFVDAVIFSIVGGGVMLLAQHKKLHIIHIFDKDVFIPDTLSNILFLSSVPFVFYYFGSGSLSFLFLWSALLNLMLYSVATMKIKNFRDA